MAAGCLTAAVGSRATPSLVTPRAELGGGLAHCHGPVENNLITGNSAQRGGGLAWCEGTTHNNTITNNSATGTKSVGGGLAFCYGAIRNCIVRGNAAEGSGNQTYESNTLSFSCIQDWSGGGLYLCFGAIEKNMVRDNSFSLSALRARSGGSAPSKGLVSFPALEISPCLEMVTRVMVLVGVPLLPFASVSPNGPPEGKANDEVDTHHGREDMSNAETETKRSSLWKKLKWAVMILVLLFAAVFVPARFLAVRCANRGTKLYDQGKYDEAMAQYQRALKFYPWLKAAREPLGEIYSQKAHVAFVRRDYARAERLYEEALKLGSEASDIHFNLAQVCRYLGKKDEALIQLEEHLKEKPRDSRALRLLSEIPGTIPEFADSPLILGKSVMDLCVCADGQIYYVDYFGNSLGFISKDNRELNVLLTGLRGPSSIAAIGTDLYFTEVGSKAEKYRDGALCVMRTRTGKKETITGGLHYPSSVFIGPTGAVYVLEAAGSQTSYGGRNRVVRFPAGATRHDVVASNIRDPGAFVVDKKGNIYIGTVGRSMPGDTAKLLIYERGRRSPKTLLSNLPSVEDMAIDPQGNLYIAGFGDDESEKVAIALVLKGHSYFVPIMRGFQAWCLALDPVGNVYYSTGRSSDSLRILRRKGAPLPIIPASSLGTEGLDGLAMKSGDT